jgi:hypothetical protein
VPRRAGPEPEDDGKPPALERDGLRAGGNRPASQPADEAHANRPARGATHMHHELAPRSVSVTWIVGVVAVALWPVPEPPDLDGGTTTLVCAALAGLALPAALVSHTAMLQLPGPGTVMVAGPAAGADAGALHEPEPLAGETW